MQSKQLSFPHKVACVGRLCLLLGHYHVGWVVGDGAGVRSVLEADVTGLTPRGAPGVSDLPVRRSINSGGLDAVIHRSAASGHDTAEIQGKGDYCTYIQRKSFLDPTQCNCSSCWRLSRPKEGQWSVRGMPWRIHR